MSSRCSPFENFKSEIIELSTSGLTHTCDKNIFGVCDKFLEIISPKLFYKSNPIVDINYGFIEIHNNNQISI